MAQPYVTGPCGIWVGVGASNAPVFLGYTERGPRIEFRPEWSPFYCDIGGSKTPFDRLYEDGEAMVSADLVYYNESTYLTIADKVGRVSAISSGSGGVTVPGAIGALAGLEKINYPLWLQFPYQNKPAMSSMPKGYRFLSANLDSDGLPELGTRVRKVALRWFCQRSFDPTYVSPSQYGYGKFTAWDYDVSALGAPV